MATRNLGTAATTTLTAAPFPNALSATRQGDFGAIRAAIKDDFPVLWPLGNAGASLGQNAIQIAQAASAHSLYSSAAMLAEGLLVVPNRGVLRILPGDWVGVDTFGWPILVSGRSIQSSAANWVITGAPT